MTEPGRSSSSRRALLTKAAAAGAVVWTAPLVTSAGAQAAAFTPKCAPGALSAQAEFTQTSCTGTGTVLSITITWSATCPCGGGATFCATGAGVSSTGGTHTFSVAVPIRTTTTISGWAAACCVDRNGDRRCRRYQWTMTATDRGTACGSASVITPPVLTENNPTPPLTTCALPAAAAAPTALPTSATATATRRDEG